MNESRPANYDTQERLARLLDYTSTGRPLSAGQSLDVVDEVERLGRQSVIGALIESDRTELRQVHLLVADTLDKVAELVSGDTRDQVHRLAENWRETGLAVIAPPDVQSVSKSVSSNPESKSRSVPLRRLKASRQRQQFDRWENSGKIARRDNASEASAIVNEHFPR